MSRRVARPGRPAPASDGAGLAPVALLGLTWQQYRLERRLFWRNPSAAFFNFLLPLMFLALLGAVFRGDEEQMEVIVPGIAGMSIMASTFSALAMNMTFLREQGVLKRMRGTPLPTGAYLGGVLANAVTNAVVQLVIVIAVGRVAFGIDGLENVATLGVFAVVGVVCFAALGVAMSHVIPNFDSAPAYVNAVFLPVIFISGVFYDVDAAPDFLRHIAEILPLVHLVEGLGAGMVTGASLADQGGSLCVLCIWALAGVVLAVRGFSWESKRS